MDNNKEVATRDIMVMVIDPPFSQITVLARALARRNMLGAYIHSFLIKGTAQGQVFGRIPYIGHSVKKNLDRRTPPREIPTNRVITPARSLECARAILTRVPSRFQRFSRPVFTSLMGHRNKILSRTAARLLDRHNVVVASYGTALEAFEAARDRPVLRVLDYPIAHHEELKQQLTVEARYRPEFADTLGYHISSQVLGNRFAEELKLSDLILVGSQYAKETFVSRGIAEEKIAVVPYPVNVCKFVPRELGPVRRPFRVGFVGAIGARKGIGDLLDAYKSFRRHDSELVLIGQVLGTGKGLASYSGQFTHIPHIPHSLLPEVMRELSVLVLPSIVEGMPIVVIEAMASGVPVIGTVNGPGQVIRDGVDGFIIPVHHPVAIAERLDCLYTDAELHTQMAQNARQRSLEFSEERYTSEVIRLISREVKKAELR